VRKAWSHARKYLSPEQGIKTVEDALAGARDIIAEWINENRNARERLRALFQRKAVIKSEVVKSKMDIAGKYSNYFDFSESLARSWLCSGEKMKGS